MKDQTELAPIPPKCPLCGDELEPDIQDIYTFKCGTQIFASNTGEAIISHSQLCKRTAELKLACEFGSETHNKLVSAWSRIKELEELANGLSDTANARGSRIKELEELLAATTRERQILYTRLIYCDHTPGEIEQILLEG